MAQETSHALGADLNTASEHQLAPLCGLGSERARRLIAARPLHGWDDVGRLEGFDPALLRDLQHAGARIGGPEGGGDRPGRSHAT